jgi:protein-S-isoprenylcysteine O-methyltransferase Ste14
MQPSGRGDRPPSRVERILGLLVPIGLVSGLFLAAGTPAWLPGWLYIAAVVAAVAGMRVFVSRRNPGLFARRARVGPGTPAWDKAWNLVFWVLMLAVLVTGALDSGRHHWTDLSIGWWPVGLVGMAASMVLSTWAMSVNPFFEGTVRIQAESGHKVVDAGPYAYIRHPGYVGLAALALSTPLMLLSCWAFVPATAATFWLVLRTFLEDRFLSTRLDGYREYANRVRFRLVPRVW